MDMNFAAIPLSNATMLCIGGITRTEAKEASSVGVEIEDSGFFLFLAAADNPTEPIEILAKFFSSEQAERAASLFPTI